MLCHQSEKDQSDKGSRSLKSSKASSCLTGPYGKPGTLLLFPAIPILSVLPSVVSNGDSGAAPYPVSAKG